MFEIINDMDKIITEERLLACIPGSRAELYEDDVADLLEEIQDADAMHPAAAFAAVQLDGVEGDAIKVGDTSVSASLFAENCHAQDMVYPCLVTVGKELDVFAARLDDPMLSYLQGVLMNLCLDDALLAVARRVAEAHPGKKLMMVKPGVAGVCELSEQTGILALLGDAADKLGVTVSDRGFLTPGYSSTALLFLSDAGAEVCSDWQDEEDRKRLLHELNVIAGHV